MIKTITLANGVGLFKDFYHSLDKLGVEIFKDEEPGVYNVCTNKNVLKGVIQMGKGITSYVGAITDEIKKGLSDSGWAYFKESGLVPVLADDSILTVAETGRRDYSEKPLVPLRLIGLIESYYNYNSSLISDDRELFFRNPFLKNKEMDYSFLDESLERVFTDSEFINTVLPKSVFGREIIDILKSIISTLKIKTIPEHVLSINIVEIDAIGNIICEVSYSNIYETRMKELIYEKTDEHVTESAISDYFTPEEK